jgi:hypothetical protein
MVALFHDFVLQKLWDPAVPLGPFLAALDTLLAGLATDKPLTFLRPQGLCDGS